MNKFLLKTKKRLEKNNNERIRFKLKTVMKRCGGYRRRSPKFVEEFNQLLDQNGLITTPMLTTTNPPTVDDWLFFQLAEIKNNIKRVGDIKMLSDFKPYPHQKEAWNFMDKHYIDEDKKRGLIVLPTGAGKTTVAVNWLIRKYINRGYRVLWLAHRVELLEQAFNTFNDFAYLLDVPEEQTNMIIVSGQYNTWSSVDARYNVVLSTDRSTALNLNYLQQMINQSKEGIFVVIDEAHHSPANQYREIIKTVFTFKDKKNVNLLGLTATPVRMNPDETQILWRIYDDRFDITEPNQKLDIDKAKFKYESKIYEVTQEELIQKNILSKPIPITINTDIDFERDFTKKDLKHLEQFDELGQDVLNRITSSSLRNKKIVDHYKENMNRYGKTLVFAVDVTHCITLNKEFQKQGIKSDYVAYSKSDNAEVIDKFKNSDELQVIISVIKLTEGFDCPNIETIFLTRPTRSEPLLRQMIGRGLRGPRAGGTDKAYLVTFVDTWELFKPLSPEYVLSLEEVSPKEKDPIYERYIEGMPLSEYEKMVDKIYEFVRPRINTDITGIFEAIPHSWYQWSNKEEGERENLVFVFNNQYDSYKKLVEYYTNNKNEIPQVLNRESIHEIIYKFFDDCRDPLPDYNDILRIVGAIRREENIKHFTFDEKEKFNPAKIARDNIKVPMNELPNKLREIFDENDLCKTLYKNIFENFLEDVMREVIKILTGETKETTVEKIDEPEPKIIDLPEYPQYEEGEGYNLEKIMEAVIYTEDGKVNKIHFPNGVPPIYRISFTSKPVRSYLGICRYSDRTIKINKFLNSPKFPRFAMEFLVYHEVLHADMPNNGHDKDFRERERKFTPSKIAIEEAESIEEAGKQKYKYTDSVDYYWYTVSNQELDTIHWDYKIDY